MRGFDKRSSRSSGTTITASAPVRTADVGGWTDTWFARRGVVCNIAVGPRTVVRVQLDGSSPPRGRLASTVSLSVGLTGDTYPVEPELLPGREPMLEHAIAALRPPAGASVHVGAEVPAGSGLGGSAAVMVALVAALSAARGEGRGPLDLARIAHRCEVAAGRESGVQDHVAAACGGISAIEVAYPEVAHRAVHVPAAAFEDLRRRLLTVSFGASHASTEVHREVIARVALPSTRVALDRIREAATAAIEALCAGDLDAYGRALTHDHEAMRALHPGTISTDAEELAHLAAAHGATGWKVNGAGGAGGSMVILAARDRVRRNELLAAIAARPPWTRLAAPFDPDGVRVDLQEERTS